MDLDAHFIGGWHEGGHRVLPAIEGAQGIAFQCPKCAQTCEPGEEDGRRFVRGAHYFHCYFRNPGGAPKVPDNAQPGPGRWWVQGTTIDNLSLVPGDPPTACSVLATSGCCAHFHVTNGAITGLS